PLDAKPLFRPQADTECVEPRNRARRPQDPGSARNRLENSALRRDAAWNPRADGRRRAASVGRAARPAKACRARDLGSARAESAFGAKRGRFAALERRDARAGVEGLFHMTFGPFGPFGLLFWLVAWNSRPPPRNRANVL